MNINIKINNKKKTYSFIDSWNDVSLNSLSRFLAYSKLDATAQALNTINLFSDMPKDVIKKLSLEDVLQLMKMLTSMQNEVDAVHKATFTIEGKKYGFIPSLEDITLGEYADIESFIKGGIETNLPNIMSVLFRPIVEENAKSYSIEGYDGTSQKERAKIFMDMNAVQVQNSMVFFCNFVNVLSKISVLYLELKEKLEKKK
tara:strand:- start:1332 stop:1934 length:603 start_codon:yes stop_codon:yes gene_type:complete